MLQKELARFQNVSRASAARIDPDASISSNSNNHTGDHDLLSQHANPRPAGGSAKRSRSSQVCKLSCNERLSQLPKTQQRSSSACADITAALNDGTNMNHRGSKSTSPAPEQIPHCFHSPREGFNSAALGPAPLDFDAAQTCTDLLAEWGVGHPRKQSSCVPGDSTPLQRLEHMMGECRERQNIVRHTPAENIQQQVCPLQAMIAKCAPAERSSCSSCL
jgi:hypothetical protein